MSGRARFNSDFEEQQRVRASMDRSSSFQLSEAEDSISSALLAVPGSSAGIPRAAAPAPACRQQFAAALEQLFNAAASAGDTLVPSTPRSGRGGGGRSRFRGVTRHKRTQRFESHIWECKKQIYLGGFDSEALAAKAHDIMALRCKPGPDGDGVLNFPRADYAPLLPTIDRLSREDVITALRNYSKLQTSKRMGTAAPSPAAKAAGSGAAATAGAPRAANAGVRKQASQRAQRRLHTAPASAAAAAGGPAEAAQLRCRLSVSVKREARAATGDGSGAAKPPAGTRTTPLGSPKSFGGKVAPRRPPVVAQADAHDAAEPAVSAAGASKGGSKRRGDGKEHRAGQAAGGPLEAPDAPATPVGGQQEEGAPLTPSARLTSGRFVPAGGSGVLSMRWQRGEPGGLAGQQQHSQLALEAAAAALAEGAMPGQELLPSALGPAAAATAAADAARRQYITEMYLHQQLQQQRQQYQALLQHMEGQGVHSRAFPDSASFNLGSQAAGATLAAALAAEAAAAAASAPLRKDARQRAAAAPAGVNLEASEVMDLDSLLIEQPPEEQSLTFSASDDAYLFQPALPGGEMRACTAVEHVNGTVLFQGALPEGQEAPAAAGTSSTAAGEALAAAGCQAGKNAPESWQGGPAAGAAQVGRWLSLDAAFEETPAVHPYASKAAAPWTYQQPELDVLPSYGSITGGYAGSIDAAAVPSTFSAQEFSHCNSRGALPPTAVVPGSPGHLISVLPAASVPHPPSAIAAAWAAGYPRPPSSVSSVLAATAAALQQAGLLPHQQQLLLQQHPSLFASLSPFAQYTSGTAFP